VCVAHLHKMERMQSVLKHYQLAQDIPAATPNFAQNISRILQETTPAEARPSFMTLAFSRYRAFVSHLVERWITSLRARPVTWVTSLSCVVVVMAGVVFMDITHTIQQPQRYAFLQPNRADTAKARRSVVVAEPSPLLIVAVAEDAEDNASAGLPDFIQFSDEPVVQIAETNSESVESYVYSHIVEASQEQLLDNAVFAGYVQDALF